MPTLKGYETVPQVAERLGVSPRRVLRLLEDDRFPTAVKIGGKTSPWLIPTGETPTAIEYKWPEEERKKNREYKRRQRERQKQ